MMHSFGYIWTRAIFKPLSEKEETGERVYLAQQELERKAYEERLTREFEENKLIIAQLEKQLVEVFKSKPTELLTSQRRTSVLRGLLGGRLVGDNNIVRSALQALFDDAIV